MSTPPPLYPPSHRLPFYPNIRPLRHPTYPPTSHPRAPAPVNGEARAARDKWNNREGEPCGIRLISGYDSLHQGF